ncbi:hypothetical protein DJ568_04245 [Mucilaginibacter hurinus]|uniref:Acetate uptake transporter n=1 Tax=Mucilaginibacter hurinus TaxID=2201324 RepID=A0A367GS77_9SPHI|nr:GPR1/FUN34/YaaH family transporter [Mucilaginibacter hurinus]RCH55968.1 hypothetical protein DJ568_04245 [Mucilaginibacter hurinus]
MSDFRSVSLVESTANPAPLGLCGFGLTTMLLNIHNAGFYEMNSMILAMGLFYGGSAQIIAGIMESKKNNTFGFTAFTSYGFFWLVFAFIGFLPKLGLADAPDNNSMIAFLSIWLIFTAFLFVGSFKGPRALQLVFGTLVILFLLLVIGHVDKSFMVIAGYEGILCGFLAMYFGMAQILNEMYGRTVLPIGA